MASLSVGSNSEKQQPAQTDEKIDLSDEILLKENPDRFVLLPITVDSIWKMYKKHQENLWTYEEIDFSVDKKHWNELDADSQHFLKRVLAFFAASDGIVLENLAERFMRDVQLPEARAFYSLQMYMENVHSETYIQMLDFYAKPEEKDFLFHAMKNIPAIQQKAQWAIRWIKSPTATFAERLVAFIVVEGIFFSGSFCSIFWLKKKGKMPGLTLSNEFISRDEMLHCVSEGTLISTEFDSIPIENMKANVGNFVQTYSDVGTKPGIVLERQDAFKASGTKPCVQLTLEDGRTLTCTPEHKILTVERGWQRADEVKLNDDTLYVKELPSSFVPTPADLRDEMAWRLGQYNMDSGKNRQVALAFARVLGFIISDGNLSHMQNQKYKRASASVFLAQVVDIASIQRDIQLAFGTRATVHTPPDKNCKSLSLGSRVAHMLASIGVPAGARVHLDLMVPAFVMSAPRSFKRAFLMGLFGGDGDSPTTRQQPSGTFSLALNVGYSFAKMKENHQTGQRCLADVIQLLAELGIPAVAEPVQNLPLGRERHKLTIPKDHIVSFAEKIGFAHCVYKQMRLGVVVSMIKMRERQNAMNRAIGERIEQLQNRKETMARGRAAGISGPYLSFYMQKECKMTFVDAYNKAVAEYKAAFPIIGLILNTDNMRVAIDRNTSSKAWDTWAIIKRFGVASFFRTEPIAADAPVDVSEDCEPDSSSSPPSTSSSDDNSEEEPVTKKRKYTANTYGLGLDDVCVPTMKMKVVHRVDVGPREVYDITVSKTGNMVANGVVVHNCDFGILLFSLLKHKPSLIRIHEIVKDAVKIEHVFVKDAIPVRLIGMNADLMCEYIEFVADRLLQQMNVPKIYHAKNPFEWMEQISLRGYTNFFERVVADYQKSSKENALIVNKGSFSRFKRAVPTTTSAANASPNTSGVTSAVIPGTATSS